MEEKNYLTEAFQALKDLDLNEDVFTLDNAGIEDASEFIKNDEEAEEVETIIDPLAETEEELQDSYIGKVILDCTVCQSKIYSNPEDVVIDEEAELANVGEECPYCHSVDGYKVIGQVAEYKPEDDKEENSDEKSEEETDEKEDNKEEDKKEPKDNKKEECFKRAVRAKAIRESMKKRRASKSLKESKSIYEHFTIEYDNKEELEQDKKTFTSKGFGVEDLSTENSFVIEVYGNNKVSDNLLQSIVREYGLVDSKNLNKAMESVKSSRGQRKLRAMKNLKEEVSDKAYEIADIVANAIKGKKSVTMDEFDEQFALACRKVLGIDNIWSTDNNSPEIENVNDLENDVRGILSFEGWETVLEGENEGGLVQLNESKRVVRNPKMRRRVKEDLQNVSVETDKETVNVSADGDSVKVETNQKNSEEDSAEMIAPIEPETEDKFEVETEEEPMEDEFQDVDIDEFEEDDFDELGEKYLRRVYENVKSYKTTKGSTNGNTLKLEGMITFKSGKKAKTNFVFEAKTITKTGKLKFLGENKQFARGKKAFTLTGTANKGKLMVESLTYNYRGKDAQTGRMQRLYGRVTK